MGTRYHALPEGRTTLLRRETLNYPRRADLGACVRPDTAAGEKCRYFDRGRARLAEINRAVNLTIKAISDRTQYGIDDFW
jgi:predicted transglutaminase-like cysteine proteinase